MERPLIVETSEYKVSALSAGRRSMRHRLAMSQKPTTCASERFANGMNWRPVGRYLFALNNLWSTTSTQSRNSKACRNELGQVGHISLTPQPGRLRNVRPTGGVAANVLCKLVRTAVEGFKTLVPKCFLSFWRLHRLGCGVSKFIDDWTRHARRSKEAEPETGVEIRHAFFLQCGHVGQRTGAFMRCVAGCDLANHRGSGRERRQGAAGNDIRYSLRASLKGHLRPFDAGALRKQFAGKMRQAAHHRGVERLVGLRFGQGNEVSNAVHVAVWINDQDYRNRSQQCNRREVPDQIEGRIGIDDLIDND